MTTANRKPVRWAAYQAGITSGTARDLLYGDNRHSRALDAYVYAPTKADAAAAFAAAGIYPNPGFFRKDASTPGAALAGAGLFSPDRPEEVIATFESVQGNTIVAVGLGGQGVHVASWTYEKGAGLGIAVHE